MNELVMLILRWLSPGSSVSSINKADRHDVNEILLKVALNTIKQTSNCIRLLLMLCDLVTNTQPYTVFNFIYISLFRRSETREKISCKNNGNVDTSNTQIHNYSLSCLCTHMEEFSQFYIPKFSLLEKYMQKMQ